MIQRKQSLWLFLAALMGAGVFYFDLYRYHVSMHKVVNAADTVVDTPAQLRVADHFPSLLIALVMTVLPLVTIFLFRNRKRQISMCIASLVAALCFVGILLGRVSGLSSLNPPASDGSYWVGAVLPVVAMVFLILAIIGIRGDEKLVRSADRLR